MTKVANGGKFLDKDGTLPKDIMPDYLHPNAKSCQIEAQTIEPTIAKLMGEKK
jgi:beta-glucosidase